MNDPKIQAFLQDIIGVYHKHGLTISHQDYQGAFEIEGPDTYNEKWLLEANVTASAHAWINQAGRLA